MSDFRLKVFRSAARHLSFTKASEELYVSQPSVTRHIRELETEYGQRLFERTGGRLLLTQAGVRMLEHVERILEAYSALEYEMKKISGESGGDTPSRSQHYHRPVCVAAGAGPFLAGPSADFHLSAQRKYRRNRAGSAGP